MDPGGTNVSPMEPRAPSGLFPAGSSRPRLREPYPIRTAPLLAGAGATALWLLLFGLLATSIGGYVWWTIFAASLAWLVALILARFGDRGVATGVAVTTGAGLAIAMFVTAYTWATTGWPLW